MEYVHLILSLIAIIVFLIFLFGKQKPQKHYDSRGFDHNHIHRNGTKFDDDGYDYFGYNAEGYNRQGYNALGKNAKGQYDRFFDTKSYAEEGFYSLRQYPIALTTHARERMQERLGINNVQKMEEQAISAYRFGKSKRQIKKTSAGLIDEMEQRYENSIVLIYRNFIYVFSCENVLITVYKNDKISL